MNPKTCPTCHASIPENAPGALCPACVLRDAEEEPASDLGTPQIEEIAAAFPQWEILGLIGRGGMGFVYRVRQPALDRTVALKILDPALGRDPAFAERFAREARTLGKLQHPNIVSVFEHGEAGGFFYLVMEHVDGVNLRQAMQAGRFTPEQALAIVPGICDALQAAHAQGVWHRDIKPENILLDRDGRVKIADFGIARLVGDPQRDFTLTRTGHALGSAAYMAPEQHEKPHDIDHRADIYSLGVVIYEMLTGELPLGRFPLPSQRAEVGKRIDEIVLRTLEKERELRQQSAGEVKTEVEGAANAPTAEKPKKRAVPKAVWIGCAGVLVLGLLLLIVPLVVWFSFRKTNLREARLRQVEAVRQQQPEAARERRPLPVPPPDVPPADREPVAPQVDTLVNWKITYPGNEREAERTVEMNGKVQGGAVSGDVYTSFAIFVGESNWRPVCMIVAKGGLRSGRSESDGQSISGSVLIGKRRFEYSIEESDKVLLNSAEWDLNRGRVFVFRPDGSLRQIAMFPERFVSANEIDEFAAEIPQETLRDSERTLSQEELREFNRNRE